MDDPSHDSSKLIHHMKALNGMAYIAIKTIISW